ncbi:MAG: hypothetical protein ACYTX0_37555 [Nostoc sp.]
MKLSFYSRFSKFNILMALCTFGISAFSVPVSASPDEVCTKTSSGEVVCGKPIQNPGSSSKKPDSDETIQTEVSHSHIWELKSCIRKQKNISCNFFISSSEDSSLARNLDNTTMVDPEGTEYHPNQFKIGKSIAEQNNGVPISIVKNIKYKTTIVFEEVPTSTPYISLLGIVYNGGNDRLKFRNIPIINPDGSFAPVPDSPKPHALQPSSNNPNSTPKICLPIVGCLH